MELVLITGKSGSGKSTFAKALAENLNYTYVDIDKVGHELYDDPKIMQKLDLLFGDKIYKDGHFKRKLLGELVFSNKNSFEVQEFNRITLEAMEAKIDSMLTQNTVLEWIKLPQTKYWKENAVKILVESKCDSERFTKILHRDNISAEYLQKRESACIEYDQKEFDFVIENDYNEKTLESLVLQTAEKILKKTSVLKEKKMNKGFYAGSFDPFTKGHLHIVKSASKIFDEVVVGIGINSKKTKLFDKNKMRDAINKTFRLENLNNCHAVIFEGLTIEAAQKHGCNHLIKGLRNCTDYDYEENLAKINENLSGIETIYFRAGKYDFISSSMVRELLAYKKDVSDFVPKIVLKLIEDSLN